MKEKVEVCITDYDYFGRGISKKNGKICFVSKVPIGYQGVCDVITTKKNFLVARPPLQEANPTTCPYFFMCGGCQLRQMSRKEELQFKQNKVVSLLKRNANIELKTIPISAPTEEYYRNKVTFHLERGKVGYYQEASNELLPIEKCRLLTKEMEPVLAALKCFAEKNKRSMTAMIRTLQNKTMLSILEEKDHVFVDSFPMVDSLYYQNKLLKGQPALEMEIFGIHFQISKNAFFQVNCKGMEVLYQKAIAFLQEINASKVLDLYCGVGTISLVIAKYVDKVLGVEVIQDAVEDAKKNASRNHINNVSFECSRVEDIVDFLPKDYDTVIVDPPRKGLDPKTKRFLSQHSFKAILYISCDAATLARDIKDLNDSYSLKKIELVDMFPKTYHVESICLLRRK